MNLDEILDQALEDFEKDNINKKAKNVISQDVMKDTSKSKNKSKSYNNQSGIDTTYGDEDLPRGS